MKVISAPKTEIMHNTTKFDRIVVEYSNAPSIWARFYELSYGKLLFYKRDGIIVYTIEEVERERRTGYG